MNFKIILLVVALVVVANRGYDFLKKSQSKKQLQSALSSGDGRSYGVPKSCVGKAYCITVFVAPWCPACKASAATFRMVNAHIEKNRNDMGFGIVVGDGSATENNAEKELLSPLEVIVDQSGAILKKRAIRGYPTWTVIDSSGKEIFHQAGGPVLESENEVPRLLSQFLKL